MPFFDLVNPSTPLLTLTRKIYDTDTSQTITIKDASVKSINGATNNTSVSWFGFTEQGESVANGRLVREVDLEIELAGALNNGVEQFTVEVEATDGTTTTLNDFLIILDNLVQSSAYRLGWVDRRTTTAIVQDREGGSPPYRFENTASKSEESSQHILYQSLEIDPDAGAIFTTDRAGEDSYYNDYNSLVRLDFDGGRNQIKRNTSRDEFYFDFGIDTRAKEVYFSNKLDGLRKCNYDGSGEVGVSPNYKYAKGIFVDAETDTLVLLDPDGDLFGDNPETALIVTTLSDPDANVSASITQSEMGEAGRVGLAVDISGGRVFTHDNALLTVRNLSDLSQQSSMDLASQGIDGEAGGIAYAPPQDKLFFANDGNLYEAPAGNLTGYSLYRPAGSHWNIGVGVSDTGNAAPASEDREYVESRL